MNTKNIPTAIEAEEALVGAILLEPTVFPEVIDIVRPEHFHDLTIGRVFEEMVSMHNLGGPLDAVLLLERLRKVNGIENPAELLGKLAIGRHQVSPAPSLARRYASCVLEASRKRQVLLLAADLAKAANHSQQTDQIIAAAIPKLEQLARQEFDGRGKRASAGPVLFDPVPISQLGGEESPSWLWTGWLARESVTLLVSHPKVGKTTLLTHYLKAASLDGGDIAGAISPCRITVISEEARHIWLQRSMALGISDQVHLDIRPFQRRPKQSEWECYWRSVASAVLQQGFDLIVVDTLQSVSPVADENDASQVIAALSPLQAITEAGASVLLVHHTRKGDGAEGTASRGSGALTGFVDIILELRRYDAKNQEDCRRVLKGYSRYDQTPRELVIELDDQGYRNAGTTAHANQEDRLVTVLEILSASESKLTVSEIRENWPQATVPPSLNGLRADLDSAMQSGRVSRSGKGVKGDPHRFDSS